jgi:hypothetical protein
MLYFQGHYKFTLFFIYRLSSFASEQPTDGNPDFTELSDINRPVKMAERFQRRAYPIFRY